MQSDIFCVSDEHFTNVKGSVLWEITPCILLTFNHHFLTNVSPPSSGGEELAS
jgi:hypothetical protein